MSRASDIIRKKYQLLSANRNKADEITPRANTYSDELSENR